MPLGLNLDSDPVDLLQQGASILSDWLTEKVVITEKSKAANLQDGFAGVVDKAKGALGLGKATEGTVTLFHYEQITDSVSADYAETVIRGRSQPYVHYTSTGLNRIGFTAKLLAGVSEYELMRTADDVMREMNLIKSWIYPEYPTDGPMNPPPTLVLTAGELYRGVPGIIRAADFTLMRPFNFFHVPMVVDVNIEFEVIYDKPVDRKHIRENGMTNYGGSKQPSGTIYGKAAEVLTSTIGNTEAVSDVLSGGGILGGMNPNIF